MIYETYLKVFVVPKGGTLMYLVISDFSSRAEDVPFILTI